MKRIQQINEINACFWAKKSDQNGVFKWLPLKQHLVDTANAIALLWEHWLSESQKHLIINSSSNASETDIKNYAKFLAAVHDIGKATPAFQIKSSAYINSADLDSVLVSNLENAGFKGIKSLKLSSATKTPHAIASHAILSNYGFDDATCSIVGGHHGKPIDSSLDIESQINAYPANYYQTENKEDAIHIKWHSSQHNIIKWALEFCEFNSLCALPSPNKASQIILEGLLIMADWIASNEDYFPLISIDSFGDNIDQKLRTQQAFTLWLKTGTWQANYIGDTQHYYMKCFGFKPNDIQLKLAEIINSTTKPGIFIVEAPMGSGKTEMALTAVQQLAAKTNLSGMFFGLPTQAKSLRLVHAKANLNSDFYSMAKNIDIDGDTSVIVNEWFSGKKTAILDDFVVGTVDNFLLSALKQKHLVLRHLGLSKKLVLIDEVHAYDAYMSQYLNRAIAWMAAYNVPVIILSATLTADKRLELIRSYTQGTGQKYKMLNKSQMLDKNDAYPLITCLDGDSIKQFANFNLSSNKRVMINKIEDDSLISTIDGLLQNGGIAGIVVNTVKRAQSIAKQMAKHFGEDSIELLHASFIASHRIAKEADLLKSIGKNANRPFKKIIIGTQVIEQSLDIDFDIMFSDLAPMDLLLQRIGRLHRHNIDRPELLKQPMFYILGTSQSFEFNQGSTAVYASYLLMRTQLVLPSIVNLPEDISALVQKAYDNSNIDISFDLQDKYETAEQSMENDIQNKKDKALAYILEKPQIKSLFNSDSLIGLLANLNPNNSDERAFAQVRDSAYTQIEIIVVKQCVTGYSFMNENSDISIKIDDFNIAKKLASQTIKLPNFFGLGYNIDNNLKYLENYNSEYLINWQQQPWLKGSLGIIFDENNSFVFDEKWRLFYSNKYGLEYEKVVENGTV